MAAALPRRLLIANRGEIAVRVTRTCHALGIEVVAVHSPFDATAPHVLAADLAVPIDDYVDAEALIEAAGATDCEAVHPGYGFLAESPRFARAVRDAGLVFIGPSAESMEVMGSKTASRRAIRQAGVPVVPGTEAAPPEELPALAEELGYPVLVKAVAGGGGKGMAAVDKRDDLVRAAMAAAEEAERSFGDGAVYLEKLLEGPRHVEVQVFGDRHGQVVALGERECSIQRRHQKIVEESPSPAVDRELRRRLSEAAVAAAAAVDYESAGTVEFLLAPDGDFFFLEMNTRLQVEHPVTEWVTGLDLVRLQLEVAAGEPLPEELSDVRLTGHALECRVYAEDPAAGFLPQTGELLVVREPTGPGIRVDSALAEGQEIGVLYDPMLAKLTTHGDDRTAAIERMREALRRFVVLGVRTNIDHLRDVLEHPAFVAGDLSTDFLERHLPDWGRDVEVPPEVLAATALPAGGRRPVGDDAAAGGATSDPWGRLGGFRLGRRAP